MMKFLKKLEQEIKQNKQILLFIFLVAITGMIFGLIFYFSLAPSQKSVGEEYIGNSIVNLQTSSPTLFIFLKSFFNNLFTFSLLWVLSISIVGTLLIVVYLFYKTFVFGYSITFLISLNFYSVIFNYYFPLFLFKMILISIITIFSVRFSATILNSIIQRRNISMNNFAKKYFSLLGLIALVSFLMSIFEVYLVPWMFS